MPAPNTSTLMMPASNCRSHAAPSRRGDPAREAVREGDNGERDQPQDRRAVGGEQQNRDNQDRDKQEREVGTLEGTGDVGSRMPGRR